MNNTVQIVSPATVAARLVKSVADSRTAAEKRAGRAVA